jgi:hypothetical protein
MIQVHENGNPECTTHREVAEDGTTGPWLPGTGTPRYEPTPINEYEVAFNQRLAPNTWSRHRFYAADLAALQRQIDQTIAEPWKAVTVRVVATLAG